MKTRKFLYVILCLMLAASIGMLLSSCRTGKDDPSESGTQIESVSENDSESNTDAESPSQDKLSVEKLKTFRLVRPQNADEELLSASGELYKKLNSKFSVTFDYRDDFVREDIEMLKEAEYEILVGYCDRDACRALYKNMKNRDYTYTLVGTKLLIGGRTTAATVEAVNAFISDVLERVNNDDEVFFDADTDSRVVTSEYAVDEILLDGSSVVDYTLVYPYKNSKFEKTLALRIADEISKISGYIVDVKSDKEDYSGKEIHVGVTNRDTEFARTVTLKEDEYFIGKSSNDHILIYSEKAGGNVEAVTAFISKLNSYGTNKKLDISIEDKTVKKFETRAQSAMSFNILTTKPDADRINRVVTTVTNYLPDTVGMQEVSPYWMSVLKTELGSVYGYVGEGRNGGNAGEYNPVFYNKTKFNLVESGTRWLSYTPDVANTKYPSSSYPRICTYAVLERKSDGVRFVHVNTHLEHTNVESRLFQVKVLAEFLEKYSDYPIILTGDFNCTSSEKTYSILTGIGFLDSSHVALKCENVGATFHSFGNANKVIDFCFENNKGIYVDFYKVVKDIINGNYPSDHYPIYIEYSLSVS